MSARRPSLKALFPPLYHSLRRRHAVPLSLFSSPPLYLRTPSCEMKFQDDRLTAKLLRSPKLSLFTLLAPLLPMTRDGETDAATHFVPPDSPVP